MGQAKQRMIEEEQQGFSNPPSKCVCTNHFSDSVLKSFIEERSHLGTCDYCGKRTQVISLSTLVLQIRDKIYRYYGDPDNEGVGYDSSQWHDEDEERSMFNREYGYILQKGRHVYDSGDLFEELGFDVDNAELYENITDCFEGKLWCTKNPYALDEDEELSFMWKKFCELVKHRCRYTFSFLPEFGDPRLSENGLSDILSEIGRVVHTTKLIEPIKAGTKLYRCRNHKNNEPVDKLKDIASPPIVATKYPNRMSPSGISMFYGAFDPETARDEAQAPDECQTIGEMTLTQDIQIVDFTHLPMTVSFWGDDDLFAISFLRSFVKELSKPIHPDDAHIEYVPTQILTEYFRYAFHANHVQGMIYSSAKNHSKRCLVLFFDQKECNDIMKLTDIIKY